MLFKVATISTTKICQIPKKVSNKNTKVGQNMSKKINVFYGLFFVSSGRLREMYRRTGDSFCIQESWYGCIPGSKYHTELVGMTIIPSQGQSLCLVMAGLQCHAIKNKNCNHSIN